MLKSTHNLFNGLRRGAALSASALLLATAGGCQTPVAPESHNDGSEELEGVSVAAEALSGSAAEQAAEQLAARINLGASRLELSVDLPEAAIISQPPMNADTAADKISSIVGADVSADLEVDGMRVMKFDTHTLTIEEHRGYVNLTDERGYGQAGANANLPPQATEQAARGVLAGFGVESAETSLMGVETLGQSTMEEDGSKSEGQAIAKKVFFSRKLGGVPVAGNRMVVSYALDGSLRKVRGLWPAIDVTKSKLSSQLSVDEVKDRAVQAMLAEGASADGDTAITLETFLEVQDDGTDVRVELRGAALTQATGPEGKPSRGVRYEFDL